MNSRKPVADPAPTAPVLEELDRLRLECALGTTALEALNIGAFAVEKRGRLVHCSCEAHEVANWGLGLGASRQLQVPGSAPATTRLHRLIRDAIECSVQGAMLIRSSTNGGEAIHAVVAPLNVMSSGTRPAPQPMASVIASNLDRRSHALARQVTALFALSPAEARLALAMATGRTPREFALQADLSIATVRSQLRAVFAKTGAGRQVELVRLLASIPPLKSERPAG